MWAALLLLPWKPWSTRERIGPALHSPNLPADSLDDVSVLIPARNEAVCITRTLIALHEQGRFAQITLVDDQSEDGTKDAATKVCEELGLGNLLIIDGTAPPDGWSGKLWALEQGLTHVKTPYVLLLDADIELGSKMALSLLAKLKNDDLDSVSVMANLFMGSLAEKLLLPAFIYFFKLIYPFRLANDPRSTCAAAAGGCVLLKTQRLREIGGFAALKDAIIDDCTLAKKIKERGARIWVGLSNDVRAVRPYDTLANIWNMVARTAYTQLRYSKILITICSILMIVGYVIPVLSLAIGDTTGKVLGIAALLLMWASYLPTVVYYSLPKWWVVTLPVAAILFLLMTWTSAYRYLRGERSRWKNRSYTREMSHKN